MSPDRPRHGRGRRLLLALAPLLAVSLPPPAEADIYTWVDDRGVQNFVDDQAAIPGRFRGRARLLIVSSPPQPARTTPAPLEEPVRSEPVEGPARREEQTPVTQGALAVALAERLGLTARPTPLQAAIALLERGISPPAGWMLEDAIDPRWMADVGHAVLAASASGQILYPPEAAGRILESVAADAGIAVVTLVPPPPPPQPPAIEIQPTAIIVETVFVPGIHPLHGPLVHHPHFHTRAFGRFSKDRSAGPARLHGPSVPHGEAASGKGVAVQPTGGRSVHGGRGQRSIGGRCASGIVGRSVQLCP